MDGLILSDGGLISNKGMRTTCVMLSQILNTIIIVIRSTHVVRGHLDGYRRVRLYLYKFPVRVRIVYLCSLSVNGCFLCVFYIQILQCGRAHVQRND